MDYDSVIEICIWYFKQVIKCFYSILSIWEILKGNTDKSRHCIFTYS